MVAARGTNRCCRGQLIRRSLNVLAWHGSNYFAAFVAEDLRPLAAATYDQAATAIRAKGFVGNDRDPAVDVVNQTRVAVHVLFLSMGRTPALSI